MKIGHELDRCSILQHLVPYLRVVSESSGLLECRLLASSYSKEGKVVNHYSIVSCCRLVSRFVTDLKDPKTY